MRVAKTSSRLLAASSCNTRVGLTVRFDCLVWALTMRACWYCYSNLKQTLDRLNSIDAPAVITKQDGNSVSAVRKKRNSFLRKWWAEKRASHLLLLTIHVQCRTTNAHIFSFSSISTHMAGWFSRTVYQELQGMFGAVLLMIDLATTKQETKKHKSIYPPLQVVPHSIYYLLAGCFEFISA